MSDQPTFTIGPPEPVLDSRSLPAVTAADEDGFVTGADLGPDHLDNQGEPADGDVGLGPLAPDPQDDDAVPTEDDLAALVADTDPDDVDGAGFGDDDLVEPVTPEGAVPAVSGGS